MAGLVVAAATVLLQVAAPAPPAAAIVPAPGPVITLDQALRAAEARQPSVRRASVAVEVAEARADQARAPLLPQATVTSGYNRQTGNAFQRPGVAAVPQRAATFDTFGTFSAGVTVSQTLWDFGQTWHRFRAARSTVEAQREAEADARLAAALAVRAAYFGARAQKALVAVAREALANQDRHLAQIRAFVEVGKRPEIDLAQARTDRANAELGVIQAENGYASGKAELAVAMGRLDGAPFEVADDPAPAVDGEDGATDALFARALAARPELKGLARQEDAQRYALTAAKGGYGPTIAAQTGATLAGTDLTALAPNWSAGVTLSWPIFQGLATRSQVREAEASLRDVALSREATALAIRLEVDQGRIAVRGAKAAIGAAGEARDNARERLRLAEGRYAAGVGNVIELGDAQTAYTTAATQVVKAEYDLAAARARLAAALGVR